MRRTPVSAALTLVASLCVAASSVAAFDMSKLTDQVYDTTLANGLKVIVMERRDAPVATFVTWANVGSVDDPKEYTGMAHMFEHMAFKGTETIGSSDIEAELKLIAYEDSIYMELRQERTKGRLADSARIAELEAAFNEARDAAYELVVPNEFGNIVDREGGVGLNAFTSADATAYFFSLPSNKAELWMAMESERFLTPVLREMYQERDVVAEERRMRTESNPIGRVVEEFLALAFKAHPYGIPIVGHMSDIMNYSRTGAMAFYEKYYAPSNLSVVAVGDVDHDDIFALASKYWDRIPYRPAPARMSTVEPEQLGERRMVIEDPSQPIYIAGWHVPEITHPDRPAIDAMLDYLGSGRTSLLYKNLVKEKKLAVDVGAFGGFPGDKYPGLAAVYAIPSQGQTNSECEEQILVEVERLRNELVSAEALEGIKARAKASFINNFNSNQGIALQLGGYQQLWGDWRELFGELDRINAVTAEDIQRVTNKYFTEKNRVVVMSETSQS